ncbi:chloride channel CLIC-like protein 1 isoform X2 [Corythoichthys intestinalis]|uniref:chloride channel CLIC-like protein 1 isoform X2 n=1 Tax=Corythoichthys intestinalis TaxID=161448 RepID=UPI0025A5BA6E|nr:chloride channel CLIC-like protein 1 isoform X2 [Corythoichthys intestinalis]
MRLIILFGYLMLASSQQLDDDWLDPYDLLNYDASTKTMRKPAEPARAVNVPSSQNVDINCGQAELTVCNQQLSDLQTQVEAQKKSMKQISQQPTCNPVFKRFLSRLLKDIRRVEMPKDTVDYDAMIRLSGQGMAEIQNFLDGEDCCRTGALDNAISQILVKVRPHDYDAWRWRFEDTFGIELDTLLKLAICILIFMVIICTQLWSCISWFVQFKRLFTICFFVSIVWNWLYLYKIAFAEHQSNIAKMDGVYEKCTGVKTIDWRDSLKEWFRSTWTLQDDPCKRYYEVLMVNPILLVPPTKAISVTITTLITEPLKHVGLGISEFLRALLKDLPITLQIPVLLTIVLAIVVFMYGSVQAVFQYGITAPLRRHRRDQPLPPTEQRHLQEIENRGHMDAGDMPQHCPQHNGHEARLHNNQFCRSRLNMAREEPARIFVETLRTASSSQNQQELDGNRRERRVEAGQGDEADPRMVSDSDDHAEVEETQRGASVLVSRQTAKIKEKPTDCGSSQLEHPKDRPRERTPSGLPQTLPKVDVQDPNASAGDSEPSVSLPNVETLGSPVQETLPSDVMENH